MGQASSQAQRYYRYQCGGTVNRIEILANELALLSNQSLLQLAQIMVEHYPTRADVLETQLGAAFFYQDKETVNE